MNNRNWVAYVSPFPFPWGQAGSRRIYGMVRSLAEAGYSVVVGCGDDTPHEYIELNEGEPVGSVKYIGLGESPPKSASILAKSVKIFYSWGDKTVAWLDEQPVKPSHVFVYGGSAQYMLRLLPWCRKNNVRLIADVVEWYDPKQMTGGVLGPFNLSAKLALHFLYPKCDGVVAISQLLADHYQSKGCPVVRIPPTLDVYSFADVSQLPRFDSSKLTLIYAGVPGKKDLLGNVIKGVAQVDPTGSRIKLIVLGPNVEQVREALGGAEIPNAIELLGRIPQSDVAKYVGAADFSVLLREPLRFANAGFPTKFVESMAIGTPIIANLTSDLGLYLHDGVEGLVCTNHSAEAFVIALNRALSLSVDQRVLMRIAARQQALKSFDFRVLAKELSRFLEMQIKNSPRKNRL